MSNGLQKLKVLQTVLERDIDLLLLEELLVNSAFAPFLIEQIFGNDAGYKELIGAWHSVTHTSLGETDLVFAFRSDVPDQVGVLVENKISANFMPQQAERYVARGKEGQRNGYWDRFTDKRVMKFKIRLNSSTSINLCSSKFCVRFPSTAC